MTMSGVRGSFGGRPGGLNSGAIEGPQKISPMPAILLPSGSGGDAASSFETANLVLLESDSHSSDTSSSVGPIWPPLGDSDAGKSENASRMVAGDAPWPFTSPSM